MVFFLFCCVFVFSIHADYGDFKSFENYNRAMCYETFSKIYPDLKDKPPFKDDKRVKSQHPTTEAFRKAHPKANVTKLTQQVKELGALAYLLEDSGNKKLKSLLNSIFISEKKDPKSKVKYDFDSRFCLSDFLLKIEPESAAKEQYQKYIDSVFVPMKDDAKYEDVIYWFYAKNFDQDALQIKYSSEKFLYEKAKSLGIWDKRQKIAERLYQFTEEAEKQLRDDLWQIIKKKIGVDRLADIPSGTLRHQSCGGFFDKIGSARLLNPEMNFFFRLKDTEDHKKILDADFIEQRKPDYDQAIHLYRASNSFDVEKPSKDVADQKITKTKFDALVKPDAISGDKKYHSFSFGNTILESFIQDSGACPIMYWYGGEKNKMHLWSIPFDNAAKLIKDKVISYRPYFGLMPFLMGSGEFHSRSALPAEVFEVDQKTWIQDSYDGGSGTKHLPQPWSHHLLNSKMPFDDFKKRWKEMKKYRKALA